MRRRTGLIGRLFRIAVGILLLVADLLIVSRVTRAFLLRAAILWVMLFIIYIGVHRLVTSYFTNINPWLGAALANVPAIIVFALGTTSLRFVGNGPGQLTATFYIGLSLLAAGVRADPGCEVMAFPNLTMRGETQLACLVFSPIDWLEDQIRSS